MTVFQARMWALSGLIMLVLCVSVCNADVSFQDRLLERIESLEKQGRGQAERLENQEKITREYKETAGKLLRTFAEQQAREQEQNNRLESQEKTIIEYKEMVGELERTVAELARATKQNPKVSDDPKDRQDGTILAPQRSRKHPPGTGNDVTRQRRMLMDNEIPVAFDAIFSKAAEVHLGKNQTIVFPYITTNIGGGYHSDTGVFIAPRAGIFLFSLTVTSYNTNHEEIMADIRHNDKYLGAAYAHADSGHVDQGSTTTVVQLAAGDEVWVSVTGRADESLWGGGLSSFMGCLIFPM